MVSINYEEEPSEKEGDKVEDIMASRIKRAWKNYRTQRIIHQYASLFMEGEQSENSLEEDEKLITEDNLSINDSFSDNFNRRQHFEDKFHFGERFSGKRSL